MNVFALILFQIVVLSILEIKGAADYDHLGGGRGFDSFFRDLNQLPLLFPRASITCPLHTPVQPHSMNPKPTTKDKATFRNKIKETLSRQFDNVLFKLGLIKVPQKMF